MKYLGSISDSKDLVNKGYVDDSIEAGLEAVFKWLGVTTTSITDGSSTNPIIINNESVTAVEGSVVGYNNSEFLFDGSNWKELGKDEPIAFESFSGPSSISSATTFTYGSYTYYKGYKGSVISAFPHYTGSSFRLEMESSVPTVPPTINTYDGYYVSYSSGGTTYPVICAGTGDESSITSYPLYLIVITTESGSKYYTIYSRSSNNTIPAWTLYEENKNKEIIIEQELKEDSTNLVTNGAVAKNINGLNEEVGELKSAFTQNSLADMLNTTGMFSSVKSVYDDDESVAMKFYGVLQRGNATGGVVASSTERCYGTLPLTTKNEKIYFDSSNYRLNVAIFRNGSYAEQSGWQSSSPYTYTSTTDCDYVVITLKTPSSPETVVNLELAQKTTYFQKSITNTNIKIKQAYVSNSGNDSNIGDSAHPLATVNKALERGAERIMMVGGDYRQQIDLSKSESGRVEILKASETGNVYFRPSSIHLATSETAVEGKTKVYSAPISVTLDANNKWLYQRNVPYAQSFINNDERMPQQRGNTFRLQSSIIKKCSSNTLSDAINEIEASDDYLWFAYSGMLYFSRPYAVSSSNPIAFSSGLKLFTNASDKNTVIMTGIDVEYMSVNLDTTINSVLTDCSCKYVYGGGCFTYDYAINATFIRCEAGGACSGNVGDGFNGHGKTGGSQHAHKTTARLYDCWSHDNNDDGFSDHDCCESEIYGGLYEYNGKAGVTPSYGSHCKCLGVYSRKNYNGFFYTGAASSSEQGVYGQLECIDCISDSNNRGTSQNNSGYQIDSTGNRMILSNCKSINNHYGFYGASGTLMTIIDCGSSGDTTVKAGSGTKTVINTTAVSP